VAGNRWFEGGAFVKAFSCYSRALLLVKWESVPTISPQRDSKLPFSIALIGTTSRRIPTRISTNQGPEKGGLIPLCGLVGSLLITDWYSCAILLV